MALVVSGSRAMARRRRARGPGRGTVHPQLDLHGLSALEARAEAERWMRTQAGQGERTVVIVTGRGNRSRGLPVLRPEIEHLLTGLRGSLVDGWEPADAGGSIHVQLRPPPPRRDPAAADRAALAREHPPGLRRRAEESLAELGITPTPALVRAEIRRILGQEG